MLSETQPFEIELSEARAGDIVIYDNPPRRARIRSTNHPVLLNGKRVNCLEVALGDVVFPDDVVRVLRRYSPGDWRSS